MDVFSGIFKQQKILIRYRYLLFEINTDIVKQHSKANERLVKNYIHELNRSTNYSHLYSRIYKSRF